jgi:hypothetical protein
VKQRRPAEVLAERFGRTGPRVHVLAQSKTATRGGGNVVSAELQECFGNACVQLGMIPSREDDMRYLTAALLGLNEQLKAREVSSTFAFAPATDVLTSAAMLAAGYRKTGLLAQHLLLDTKRVDAILWTRRTGATSDAADAA